MSRFFVPLGVGAHLKKWGVEESRIQEFNWWETHQEEDLQLVFTPARHFSGRGLNDRFSTMWGSWVIGNEKIASFVVIVVTTPISRLLVKSMVLSILLLWSAVSTTIYGAKFT